MAGHHAILDALTPAQAAAVQHLDGPMLVLAGPGSGKTRVITRRVAWLIQNGIPAWSILALTFTNKAAGEMRIRIDAIVPADVPGRRGLTVSTFHSLCARLLRRFAREAGLTENYSIYDSADQRAAVKQALKDVNLDSKNWTPGSVHSHVSDAKNKLIDAAMYARQASDFFTRNVAKAFTAYEAILRKANALDFDDLLLRVAFLLRDNERIRAELQERYQYLLIDEYQDTNHAQFVIAHTLASKHRNISVVGDPDQSIYGWRGADIRNILDFESHYPEAKVIPLGQNFRSTGHIVATADKLIRHNRQRKHKDLYTDHPEGEKPRVVRARDEHHEAEIVVDELLARSEAGAAWKDMAVMYRVNALSRVVEEHCRHRSIPYVIARGTAFYERQGVKDALAYVRVLANPGDEVSLRRIVNAPPRGIGRTTIEKIELHAFNGNRTLFESMCDAHAVRDLTSKASRAVSQFVGMIERWRAMLHRDSAGGRLRPDSPSSKGIEQGSGPVLESQRGLYSSTGPLQEKEGELLPPSESPLRDIVELIIRESGLEAMYRSAKSEEDQERLENLEELISSAAQFVPPLELGPEPAPAQTLAAWLESIALVSDADMIDPERGAVTLMTLHAAKGLEFPVVCMIGLEEGLLPHINAMEGDANLEEERRLCYVGITRAERHLLLTSAEYRTHRGLRERTMMSQFLRELPPDHVSTIDLSQEEDGSGEDVDDRDGGRDNRSGRRIDRADTDAVDHDPYVESKLDFRVGSMVRHPQFGLGRIEEMEGRGDRARARVAFTQVGRKTLILKYARLVRVG
jgi:DNA helicase-2/ATP-dependent DNA helicase PcrA